MLKSIRNDLHKLDSDGQEDDNEKIHVTKTPIKFLEVLLSNLE